MEIVCDGIQVALDHVHASVFFPVLVALNFQIPVLQSSCLMCSGGSEVSSKFARNLKY
jgi:hypothetical protein